MAFNQETGSSCDEQQKKAPSEMGKTGLGLKKGESVVRLSLSPFGPEQTLWAIRTPTDDGRDHVAHGDDADHGVDA